MYMFELPMGRINVSLYAVVSLCQVYNQIPSSSPCHKKVHLSLVLPTTRSFLSLDSGDLQFSITQN